MFAIFVLDGKDLIVRDKSGVEEDLDHERLRPVFIQFRTSPLLQVIDQSVGLVDQDVELLTFGSVYSLRAAFLHTNTNSRRIRRPDNQATRASNTDTKKAPSGCISD